jgi:hypothetical protein
MSYAQSFNRGNIYHKGDIIEKGVPHFVPDKYLFKLTTGSGAIVADPTGVTPSATRKKLKIELDGVVMYLLAATDWSA